LIKSGLGYRKVNTQKIDNHDIATNNQQDLIMTLSQNYALKIDFDYSKSSRMGNLFVSGLGLTDIKF
jgi:hypothetical protein